ncbi:MAG: hypothetical protein Q9222_004106 [Ikaeria aurantiellina]
MGVKPPLPAPTESSTLQTSGGSVTGTDLATDVSRRTDKTSFSIPEDGSPVTISTKKRRDNRERDREHTLTKASHHSQTSLLIEYFEGGKGPNVHARPSVRVKVTPSAARKIKDTNEHIQVTEVGGNRKPSYTRRISLGPKSSGDKRTIESADEKSISSYNSAADDSNVGRHRPPVEIEVMKGEGSDVSGASVPAEKRYINQTASEISSMPPDSMLEGNGGYVTPKRTRSRSISQEAVIDNNTLKTPSRRRSRSLSKERLTQKVIEKLGSRPREVVPDKRRADGKLRSRSVSKEQMVESSRTPKRRSSRQHHEEISQSGTESMLTDVSPKRKSGDQYSFRSGTSRSSINNPRLLETVEDAIRRLILPELTNIKQEQKMHQNRDRFERGYKDSTASSSGATRDGSSRRVSKHASAPDVNPKVVLNRDENNAGTVLSGDSVKGRKGTRYEIAGQSPSERSFEREMSEETVIRDEDRVHRKKSKDGHRLRDAAAGGLAGGILTAAALKHHDSKSSVDSRERRRRRRSKSHSRKSSFAGSTEEIFYKHDVPPMPMRSDIHSSELTRDSILSDRTEEPASPSVDLRQKEIREVSRGSPREILSPASRTPTRTPLSGKGLATHHSNHSRGDLSIHSAHSDKSLQDEKHHSESIEYDTPVASDLENVRSEQPLARHDIYHDHDGNSFAHRAQHRGLSPIQSVASYREDEDVTHQETLQHAHSSGSLSSTDKKSKENSALSIKSLSSLASTNLARSNRPKGISLERSEDVLDQHEALRDSTVTQSASPSRDHAMDDWYERQHEENERYRESYASSNDPRIDVRHMTNYTDDSMDAPYLDRVTESQHLQDIGANPEYIHTPVAVESAVASLHDPSVLSVRSRFGNNSITGSEEGHREHEYRQESAEDFAHDKHEHVEGLGLMSGTKGLSPDMPHEEVQQSPVQSPRQSIARSVDEHEQESLRLGATGLPDADNPMPEIGHIPDSDSDLNTNPSIIQGPIGGVQHGSRDHWPYQETPPQPKNEFTKRSNESSAHDSLKAAAATFLNTAAHSKEHVQEMSHKASLPEEKPSAVHDEYEQDVNGAYEHRDSYSRQSLPTPPMNRDEGYVSAQQPRSPGLSPESKTRSPGIFEDPGINIPGSFMGEGDPFVGAGKHARHLSGYSQGMPSPLYDSATGGGMDRIQSKDIVALMDHLTVRDAQRNARDTEILVTLVRSAAEMRNSFEDMKKFIADQDDMIIDTGNKQHDQTVQKIIGGPRPQPLGTPRAPRRSSAEDEAFDELPKRKNVFKRALKGLGGRNSNDLARMEEMLIQLLGEVEELKAGQRNPHHSAINRSGSQDSYNTRSRDIGADGYEPEGQAGTSSTGNHSAYFSNSPSRQANAMRSSEGRLGSQNRISTVLEGDEELDSYEQNVLDHQFENNEELLTPTREYTRAESAPLATPPQARAPTGANSNENTPRTGTDKSRKHKSSSSSFFPKISRWSKTTTSSTGDNVRSSRHQPRPLSEASRSGSDVQYNGNDHYDPQGEDRLRSNDSLANDPMGQEARPRSPLVPSTVSEDPKYQAHRNSLNLQHPQPRPGPTHRYQTQLESRAHDFGSPISPTSDTWGSNPSLARFAPVGPGNRHSGNAGYLSPISDAGGSEASASTSHTPAPPRPPKVRDDGPLIPARPPKVQALSQEHLRPEQRYSNASLSQDGQGQVANGSPRSPSGTGNATVQQRKPTGPRPITSSGTYSPSRVRGQGYISSPSNQNGKASAEDVVF